MFVQFSAGESQTNYQFRRIFWGMLRSEDKVRFWMLDLDATQASGWECHLHVLESNVTGYCARKRPHYGISVTLLRAVILTLDIMLVSTSEYPLHEHSGLKNARIPL